MILNSGFKIPPRQGIPAGVFIYPNKGIEIA